MVHMIFDVRELHLVLVVLKLHGKTVDRATTPTMMVVMGLVWQRYIHRVSLYLSILLLMTLIILVLLKLVHPLAVLSAVAQLL